MDMLSNSSVAWISSCTKSLFARLTSIPCPPKKIPRRTPPAISVLKSSFHPVCQLVEEDVFQMFLRERKLNGDFVSKVSDVLWHREILNFVDDDASKLAENPQEAEQVTGSNDDDGYLKLSRTQEWILGKNPAPMNKKAIVKGLQDDSEKRKKLNLLKYGALKRELMLLSVSIGTACSTYCLVVLSFQVAISYAVGVLFGLVNATLMDMLGCFLLNCSNS
uniref:Uncharacterized protein MANES_04G001400 n=1 Tax=Rhizophora mucronata TaxID=61149 RepID=A0A2P2L142_RHIMU